MHGLGLRLLFLLFFAGCFYSSKWFMIRDPAGGQVVSRTTVEIRCNPKSPSPDETLSVKLETETINHL